MVNNTMESWSRLRQNASSIKSGNMNRHSNSRFLMTFWGWESSFSMNSTPQLHLLGIIPHLIGIWRPQWVQYSFFIGMPQTDLYWWVNCNIGGEAGLMWMRWYTKNAFQSVWRPQWVQYSFFIGMPQTDLYWWVNCNIGGEAGLMWMRWYTKNAFQSVSRPPIVRPKNLTIGGQFFNGKI